MTKISSRKVRVGLVVIGTLLVCGLASFWGTFLLGGSSSEGINRVASAIDVLLLTKPAFAQDAGATFLEEEAGMSAYTNIGQPIDLSVAKTLFKTIEQETEDYIVGTLPLPGLPETEDVHCFVHKDGWIVAYYLKAEPASKVVHWEYYSPGNLKTKLQVGLEEMCNGLGVMAADINYYHFHHPFANKWMIITDCATSKDPDNFNLKIPGDFTFYERSWSHYTVCPYPSYLNDSKFNIDGNKISWISEPGGTEYGILTPAQLSPDVFHTVVVDLRYWQEGNQSCCAIVLVYLEP